MSKIHPTAIVNPDAQLDPSVEVGPFCIVGPKVKIGAGTKLASHVVIEGNTTIGKDNTIFPFAVIGVVPQDLKYKGEPTQVIIGDKNLIREGVQIHLGTVQGGGVTKVGNQNLIMGYVHLGHDCIVGNSCILANYVGLAGHVILEDFVTLGGMTGVSQFVRVGAHSYIGAQSGLEKDAPPFTIARGSRPCSPKGANIVGLRRRGFAAETITKINEAIKLWSRSDVTKEQTLLEIESQYSDTAEIQQFVLFIKNSEAGVIR